MSVDHKEIERLAHVAQEGWIRGGTTFTPSIRRWEAVVRALLADPAVLAAVWRAGAEAMREVIAYEVCGHYCDEDFFPDCSDTKAIRDLPLPAYPGGAKGGEEG